MIHIYGLLQHRYPKLAYLHMSASWLSVKHPFSDERLNELFLLLSCASQPPASHIFIIIKAIFVLFPNAVVEPTV